MGLDTLSQKNTAENGAPTTVEAGANCAHGSSHTSTSASKLQSVSEGPAYSVPDFLAIAGATGDCTVSCWFGFIVAHDAPIFISATRTSTFGNI